MGGTTTSPRPGLAHVGARGPPAAWPGSRRRRPRPALVRGGGARGLCACPRPALARGPPASRPWRAVCPAAWVRGGWLGSPVACARRRCRPPAASLARRYGARLAAPAARGQARPRARPGRCAARCRPRRSRACGHGGGSRLAQQATASWRARLGAPAQRASWRPAQAVRPGGHAAPTARRPRWPGARLVARWRGVCGGLRRYGARGFLVDTASGQERR